MKYLKSYNENKSQSNSSMLTQAFLNSIVNDMKKYRICYLGLIKLFSAKYEGIDINDFIYNSDYPGGSEKFDKLGIDLWVENSIKNLKNDYPKINGFFLMIYLK